MTCIIYRYFVLLLHLADFIMSTVAQVSNVAHRPLVFIQIGFIQIYEDGFFLWWAQNEAKCH